MLIPFGQNIWIAEGDNVEVFGFHYPTRMAVIRLSDQSLFIWSPISLNDELKSEIDKLGEISCIVAPNSLHHLSIPEWHNSYPKAKLYAAPDLKEKRKDISFDEELSHKAPHHWVDDLEQIVVLGNVITKEVIFFHKPSGTTLFVDLLQQFPKDWHSGWRKMVAKLDLMVEPEATVPRKFRLAFTNRKAARASVKPILAWSTKNVIMAHGTPVKENGAEFLNRAFSWLMK